jgi:hypothetical protein
MLTSRSPRVVRGRLDLPLDPESRMSADIKAVKGSREK